MIFILKAHVHVRVALPDPCILPDSQLKLNLLCTLQQQQAFMRALQSQMRLFPDTGICWRLSASLCTKLTSVWNGGGRKRDVAETFVQPSKP